MQLPGLLLIFPLLVSAFSSSSPIVAWSSQKSNVLEAVSSSALNPIQGIVANDLICDHDAVIFIDHLGLHASDLRGLHPSSLLAKRLTEAPSSIQIEYSPSAASVPVSDLARLVSTRCNSQFVHTLLGGKTPVKNGGKHAFCVEMEPFGTGSPRKPHMLEQERLLSSELSQLTSLFSDHLIIYTSSPHHEHGRRQLDNVSSGAFKSPFTPWDDLPEGGILKRYQLLTPALIMSLLVAFFVLVPAVMLGVNALTSIQSPLREGPPKAFNARDKKNQ